MSLWSKLKNAVKKAVKAVVRYFKAVARMLVRLLAEIVQRAVNWINAIAGSIAEKNLRVHVVILHEPGQKPLVTEQEAQDSINRAAAIIKDRFDVRVTGFGEPHITTLKEDAPAAALNVECSFDGNVETELEEGGEFFASHLAGWNVVPVTIVYPVTVFVIAHVTHSGGEWRGCSAGIFTDYVVLTPKGMNDDTTLAHELGHACSLLHRDTQTNLMYHGFDRGTSVTGWQKFWFRTSRHVNFY